MTYGVGMVGSSEVLIAADSLMRRIQAWDGIEIDPKKDQLKIFPLTDHIVIMLAGPVIEIESFIAGQKPNISSESSVQDVAEHMGLAAFGAFHYLMVRYNKNIEMIVGGMDRNNEGKRCIPRLYYLEGNKGANAFEVAYGSIGYRATVQAEAKRRYQKSNKKHRILLGVAKNAVAQATIDYPEDVGGDYTLVATVTTNGIKFRKHKCV